MSAAEKLSAGKLSAEERSRDREEALTAEKLRTSGVRTAASIAAFGRVESRLQPGTDVIGLDLVRGRLSELSARDGATLTAAAFLVREVQLGGELAAWVGLERTTFHPEDFAASGIDLKTLPVVRLPKPKDIPAAVDLVVRSGAFGLVVVDLSGGEEGAELPLPMQTRLAGLAQKYETAIVCLTAAPASAASLGSLFTVRVEPVVRRVGEGRGESRFTCDVKLLKDKSHRGAIGGSWAELRRGPDGLC